MNKRSNEGDLIHDKSISIFKEYLWNKSWARQYESPFGLVLNFCKINVLTFPQAYKMLKLTNKTNQNRNDIVGRSAYYSDEIGIDIAVIGIKTLSPIRDVLELTDTMFFTDSVLSSKAYEAIVEQKFRYCPVCIKQSGYHSYYHQLHGVSQCFIHHVDLVTTEIEYSLSVRPARTCSWQEPEIGLPGSYTDIIPLPSERVEINIPQIKSPFPYPVKNVFVGNSSEYLEPPPFGAILITKQNYIKPVIKIRDIGHDTGILQKLYEFMIDAVCEEDMWFERVTGRKQTKEEKLNAFKTTLYIKNYAPGDAMLYQKIKEMTKKYKIYDERGNIKHNEYLDRDSIPSKRIDTLLLHFIRMIVGVYDVQTALSTDWIEHPQGGMIYDPYHLYEFHIRHLYDESDPMFDNRDFREDYTLHRWPYRRIDLINVAIVNDAVDFMWNQCLEKAKNWPQETINVIDFLTNLFVPNYMIVWMKNNEVWIYRASGIPKRKLNYFTMSK